MKEQKFKEKFDKYVCPGDSKEVAIGQYVFKATIQKDFDTHIDDSDCFNPDRKVTGLSLAGNRQLKKDRKAWFNDEWIYVGIVISATTNGIEISDHLAALWGLEANLRADSSTYLDTVANELLNEALIDVEKQRHAMIKKLIG